MDFLDHMFQVVVHNLIIENINIININLGVDYFNKRYLNLFTYIVYQVGILLGILLPI